MSIIFEATLSQLGAHKTIRLPLTASEKLPSRGMVMVHGTIGIIPFQAPLEPDGKGSHWLELDDTLVSALSVAIGQSLHFDIEPSADWPEPVMPSDIMDTLAKAGLLSQWHSVTTKARWEWLRWIRATNSPATRQKRIDVACDKLMKGDKRPCCFNASSCTVADISKSGILMD